MPHLRCDERPHVRKDLQLGWRRAAKINHLLKNQSAVTLGVTYWLAALGL
jgi:hypothetical protein